MPRFARGATPALIAALWLGCLETTVPADDATVATAETTDPRDVSAQVEVTFTGSLRGGADGVASIGVVVRNTSDAELTGRLVLVIDEVGINGLEMAENDGPLAAGDNCLELLPATGKLKAGARTTSRRLELTATQPLTAEARKSFAPQYRVLQVGASEEPQPETTAATQPEQNIPGKSYTQTRLNQVMAIQDKYTAELMRHEGVFGTATAEDDNGNPVIAVYTQRHGIIKNLPSSEYEGVKVEQSVTGTSFRAGPAWRAARAQSATAVLDPLATIDDLPADPTALYDFPVPIGVSMFNDDDNLCAAGTLGARIVFPDGTLGVLTNSHVGAQESDPSDAVIADPANGIPGDQWVQPGCLDGFFLRNNIAHLTDYQTFDILGVNYIDAAVGRIDFPNTGLVAARTPIDGYGFPSRTPVSPKINERVLKYGRTTGFREGKIRGINANVIVAYTSDDIFFANQITVYGDNLLFGDAGDSGSLIVTEQGHHPVALLYAGGGFATLGNPIQMVLDRFDIAIDDGTSTPPRATPAGGTTSPGGNYSGRMGGAGGRLLPVPIQP